MAEQTCNPTLEIQVEPVFAYRRAVAKWARDLETRNPYFSFWFLESGRARINWAGGERRIPAGRAVLIPAGLRRHHRFSPDARLLSLSFRAWWENGRALLHFQSPAVASPAASRLLFAAARRAIELSRAAGRDPSPAGRLAFHGALELFVAEILRWATGAGILAGNRAPADPRLSLLLQSLDARLQAGPLPFAEWKRETGLSRVHIERIARRELGHSLRAHRDGLLLSEVRRSLDHGGESLKETAARFGFFDAAHFTRWVRKQTGRNPSELRRLWV